MKNLKCKCSKLFRYYRVSKHFIDYKRPEKWSFVAFAAFRRSYLLKSKAVSIRNILTGQVTV